MGVLAEAYRILDNMVCRVVDECCDDRTLVVVISDHGCVPNSKIIWIGNALRRAGLLKHVEDPETRRISVDWSKTKAAFYFSPPEYIWVNLKGREPDGIVDPKDYERVRHKIIRALYTMKDPETGECPVALALTKEEAGSWANGGIDVAM